MLTSLAFPLLLQSNLKSEAHLFLQLFISWQTSWYFHPEVEVRGARGLLHAGIRTRTLKYLLTSTTRVDWINTINLHNFSLGLEFSFAWKEREWRNGELFTFYSTRASLLLLLNVTSVTCGLNWSQFTITVNARCQIGRWTSDQMDRSVCALRWQLWWLHCGLSIKISSAASTERDWTGQNPSAAQNP